MAKPELEFAMIYRLRVEGPLESRDGSPPSPRTRYWQMKSATLEGPRIRATTPLPGIDWFSPYEGEYGRPHVRLPFETDDGALVLLEYWGIVHASQVFTAAVNDGTATDWGDQYMRMALSFETTSAKYGWLTQNLFVARGRLLGAKELEYEVYRLT